MNWINNSNGFHETDIPTPKLKVVTKISKWDNYELVIVNDMKYIKGSSANIGNELFTFKEINSPVVLYALLELHAKIKVKYQLMQREIAKNISDSDIELIIDFCKKYGMPFWCSSDFSATTNFCLNNQNTSGDIARDTILRPVVPFATENYFHVASFIQGLHWLKMDFLRIVACNEWDEDINIQHLLSKQDKKILAKLNENIIKGNEFTSTLYTPNLNPFTTYWHDNCLALNCENIMHLSAYYICVLQQTNDYTGGYIRHCKKCGSLFVTPQSRQQFCNNPCTRQSYYQAQKRKSLK